MFSKLLRISTALYSVSKSLESEKYFGLIEGKSLGSADAKVISPTDLGCSNVIEMLTSEYVFKTSNTLVYVEFVYLQYCDV